MKKLFNSLFVIIAVMVTFAGCMKEDVNTPASETKTVQFFSESIETKTHFGDASTENDIISYPTLWDDGDQVKVLLNLEAPAGVKNLEGTADVNEISDDFKSASFSATLNSEHEFKYYTFYAVVPAVSYNAKSSNEGRFTIQIPSAQTPQPKSVDKTAQILCAISETTDTFPEGSVQLDFKHFTAYGKLTLKNLTNSIETVNSITLEIADVSLAGKWNYYVADGSVAVKDNDAKLFLTTSETENIWFACAPVDVSGKEMTLVVNTDKGPLEKKVTFPTNCKFEAGKISSFAVDMEGIEPTVSEEAWVSTKFADLKAGDQVVIVSTKGTSNWAMSNDNGTSKAPNGVTGVTYLNNQLTTDPDENIIWYVGVEENNRIFYKDSDKTSWLYCTSANNGVRVGNNEANTFTLDAAFGYLKHNGTNRYVGVYTTTPDWRCYTSINSNIADQTFQFFVKSGESGGEEGGETPTDPVQLIMSEITCSAQTENSLTFTWTAVANATGYEVTCNNKTETVNDVEYTATGLTASTGYTISVKAVGDGINYTTSEAKTQTGKTSDAQGGGTTEPEEPEVTKEWKLVTDASSLKAGDKIAIVSDTKGKIAGSLASTYLSPIDVTISDETFSTLPTGAVEFNLGGASGSWTLVGSDGKLLGATDVKKLAWDKGTTTWTISIIDRNATIQNTTESYGRILYNAGSPRFTTYTSNTSTSMLLPQIYRYE